MSDTKNVKIGVCQVSFDGVDLGYTKGGVEVTVSTETHKVSVDQFGKSTINELVTGREVKAKAPLAETTIDNLVRIMPGASKVGVSAVAQVSTVTIATIVSAAAVQTDTITIAGKAYAFTSDATPVKGEIALGLVAAINADATCPMTASTTAIATSTSATVVLTAKTAGSAVTVTVSANLTVALTTASVVENLRVDVSTGIGVDLLSTAKELRLHPISKAANDTSEDFVIPLAATAGALQFAYKLEEERIYNVEFTGYPDPTSGRLFYIGNKNAV